jgi:hypothetical protein
MTRRCRAHAAASGPENHELVGDSDASSYRASSPGAAAGSPCSRDRHSGGSAGALGAFELGGARLGCSKPAAAPQFVGATATRTLLEIRRRARDRRGDPLRRRGYAAASRSREATSGRLLAITAAPYASTRLLPAPSAVWGTGNHPQWSASQPKEPRPEVTEGSETFGVRYGEMYE